MKYLISLIAIFISLQFFSVCTYAQQYEDIVYLKNGSIIHGIITEHIPGVSVKIKTNDGNIFIFKMDEIEKMTKEEVVIKKDVSDSIKTKDLKTNLKQETPKKKKKELIAKNSITIQPIGLFTVLSNIEYDRALSSSFSMGLKISFMTFFARGAFTFEGDKEDVDKAETMKESLSAWGIGTHMRLYTGGKAVEGFFIGLAVEKLSVSYDDVKYDSNHVKTTKTYNPGMVRLEFEIGNKIKLSDRVGGFTILWTLGAGVGFGSNFGEKGNDSETFPLGSFGFGIGYSF
ncbi:MAG: hypothetical protein EHM58_09090 [Ignavibacteriae bacterium]|nr:MAG: hypothetical protein EHM58_09090 [Ignavibacteriota bacterium]